MMALTIEEAIVSECFTDKWGPPWLLSVNQAVSHV